MQRSPSAFKAGQGRTRHSNTSRTQWPVPDGACILLQGSLETLKHALTLASLCIQTLCTPNTCTCRCRVPCPCRLRTPVTPHVATPALLCLSNPLFRSPTTGCDGGPHLWTHHRPRAVQAQGGSALAIRCFQNGGKVQVWMAKSWSSDIVMEAT